MAVSQNQQELIIEVIAIDAKPPKSAVSSVPTSDEDVLSPRNIHPDDSLVVIEEVHVSEVQFEVHDGECWHIEETPINNLDDEWLLRVVG